MRHKRKIIIFVLPILVVGLVLTHTSVMAQTSGTCLPDDLSAITRDNADQVVEIARWGRGAAYAAAWSPDGQTLVVGGSNGIWVFDAASPDGEGRFLEHGDIVNALAFTPDSNRMASASYSAGTILWDMQTEEELFELDHGKLSSDPFVFSADGTTLYDAAISNRIYRWNLTDDNTLEEIDLIEIEGMRDYVLSLDNTIMATYAETIQIHDMATGEIIADLGPTEERVYSLAFSPANDLLAVGITTPDYDRYVVLWSLSETDDPVEITRLERESIVTAITFSPDGSMLTIGQSNGVIQTWSLFGSGTSLSLLPEFYMEAPNEVQQLSFNPDGDKLVSVDLNRNVLLWSGITGEALPSPTGFINSTIAAVSPDSQSVAIIGGDDVSNSGIRIIELATCSTQLEIATEPGMISAGIIFNPDGSQLVGGGDDGLWIWDTATGEQIAHLRDLRSLSKIDMSPDGTMVAAGKQFGGSVVVWDLEAMALLNSWTAHEEGTTDVAFSPDSSVLATGSNDMRVRLWNPRTGEEISTLEEHEEEVKSVAYNPDGRILVSGDWKHNIRLWNPATGVVRAGFDSSVFVRTIEFSPDGMLLAIAGRHSRIELLDPFSGSRLITLDDHTRDVITVAFSPDGRFIVSSGWDGTIRFWGVPIDD